MIPTQFRTVHGPCSRWTPADFDAYEHLVEGTDPVLARAACDGLVVTGRHVVDGEVVVSVALSAATGHGLVLTD
ncbi:hypothetical protein [Streptomyces sp. S186]|uniref:hypothetical protein n=1 Tax=Streptomyces sp. S186 TaxID=3434395 RepID=UPI003F66AFE6